MLQFGYGRLLNYLNINAYPSPARRKRETHAAVGKVLGPLGKSRSGSLCFNLRGERGGRFFASLRMTGDVLNDRVSLLIAEFFSLGIP